MCLWCACDASLPGTVRQLPLKHMSASRYFDFKIHLRDVTLSDHPLFSKEDMLCHDLHRDYAEYQRRRAIDLVL